LEAGFLNAPINQPLTMLFIADVRSMLGTSPRVSFNIVNVGVTVFLLEEPPVSFLVMEQVHPACYKFLTNLVVNMIGFPHIQIETVLAP
jgi:hypothetical protein